MTTKEIANRLVELCNKGEFEEAQKELYDEDAVSIEQRATAEFEKETKGLNAIMKKGEVWMSMVEKVHNINTSEPVVANDSFACTMRLNVTMKERGDMDMTELCVYKVKDGKIVSEEFIM